VYRLLVLDMDGTLLNSEKFVTSKVQSAIRKLTANGCFVTIASGRFPASVWLHAKYLMMNFPLIALNGSAIVDSISGGSKHISELPKTIAMRIVEVIRKYQSYVHFYGYHALFVEKLDEVNQIWPLVNVVHHSCLELTSANYRMQKYAVQIDPVGDLARFVNSDSHSPILKATIIEQSLEKLESLFSLLKGWPDVQVYRTGRNRFDVNFQGVSKQGALKRVCDDLGILASEVVAVGDSENDLEMIQWAGLGVAMGNGEPCVLKVADAVTTSNDDDGVANVIHKAFHV
jgi:Cof subfamily protein (haloacid dehalogenase superfamily)